MPNYSNVIGEASVSDAMLPPQIITDIIQEAPKSSVVLSHAKRAVLSTQVATQPVLASLPDAYWINGRTGLMQTSEADWDDLTITAEDLGVIVPISNTLINDVNVPLWDQVKPLLAEAIGKKIDSAALFGVDKPSSWPDAVIPTAISKGNSVARGTGADLGVDVAMLGQKVASQGFGINGFAAKPGMQWELVGLRNEQGDPIYTQTLSGSPASGLYGFPINEVDNGAWDAGAADLVGLDWRKFVVGIRSDITYDIYREGVISNAEGKIVLNLMQQRMTALVVTARIGFQVANPITRLGGGYPAGVVVPSTAAAASFTAPMMAPVAMQSASEPISSPVATQSQAVPVAAPVATQNASEAAAKEKPLGQMKKTELVDYAEAHGIDLAGCSTKQDILDAIAEAE